jgi:hypothetical protein
LKRKLLLQQQACTSSESDLAEKNKVLTWDMYMYRLRHIHDPVLSSLKMEDVRLAIFYSEEVVLLEKLLFISILWYPSLRYVHSSAFVLPLNP